ncbi:hypothetical protein BN2497_8249 [Janthinobacterium sp. CG23_2]|nr:hypothetical protein BN2497_8249 [Janthinobacterium sp. CG23_2]CUU30522.1 hypothetical protein BN3177_8249 [Janthinobacterium sp. CG23_2]
MNGGGGIGVEVNFSMHGGSGQRQQGGETVMSFLRDMLSA